MCAFLYERGIQGKQCDPFTIATAFIQEQCVSVSLTVPLQREQGQLLTQATTGTSSHISLHGGACIPTSKVGAWWFFLVFLGRLFFFLSFLISGHYRHSYKVSDKQQSVSKTHSPANCGLKKCTAKMYWHTKNQQQWWSGILFFITLLTSVHQSQ